MLDPRRRKGEGADRGPGTQQEDPVILLHDRRRTTIKRTNPVTIDFDYGADSWLGVELRSLSWHWEAVAREGSFGKAATALGYTQSAVSSRSPRSSGIVGHRLIERPGGPKPSPSPGRRSPSHPRRRPFSARIGRRQADLTALAEVRREPFASGVFQKRGAADPPRSDAPISSRPGRR